MSGVQSAMFTNLKYSVCDSPAVTRRKSTVANRSLYRRDFGSAEALLIERLKAGDADALETVFNTYSKKLYDVALRILGEAADTQEVVQDVFWTVFRKVGSFQGKSRFSTWLYRLTLNASLGRIRQRKKMRECQFEETLPKDRRGHHHRVRPEVDWADTLDEKYARCEMRVLLSNALQELKPIDKKVTVLSDLEGLPDKEIAMAVDLSVSAVKSRLHRARLFLREKLFQARCEI